MILKYKYHSDSGLLEAYRSYTLAQNNSLSDTIVVTSTASDAERYNYCLEFICYNSKSIPKAQYISPILNYASDGITFSIPNNLTEFRGHVDMQLTGYDPNDNSIVFKSISKNCKAFDVEGSLCVLEQDLNDTPNVFTEVLKQLEDLKNIHQEIIDKAMEKFSQKMLDIVLNFKWYKVKFYDNGELLDEQWVVKGAKITSTPQYTLPQYCVLVDGWYNADTNSIWDLDVDTVQGDTDLHLNYMTDDIVITNGMVMSFGRHSREHIYVPEFYKGYKVNEVFSSISQVPYETHIHLGNNMEKVEALLMNANVLGLYFPLNNSEIISDKGALYIENDGIMLVYAPKNFQQDNCVIMQGCVSINSMAINTNRKLRKLDLPDSLEYIMQAGIYNTGLKELELPSNILELDDYAVYNNFDLERIILKGDCSNILTDNTFINEDTNGEITRPKLCVYPQYYANYKAQDLVYEIQVIGQDYFDSKYEQKGE